MYILLFIASVSIGSSGKPASKVKGALKIIKDPAVILDLNDNGRIDYWRFYKKGRLSWIKVDRNEDGKLDLLLHYDSRGYLVLEKYDRNLDGSYDFIKECKGNHCVRFTDLNYSGKAEVQVISYMEKGRIREEVYISPKDNGKYIKHSSRLLSNKPQANTSSTEAGLSGCDEGCKQSLLEELKNISTALDELGELDGILTGLKFGKNDEYEETYTSALVHDSCSPVEKEQMAESMLAALKKLKTCLGDVTKPYFGLLVKILRYFDPFNRPEDRVLLHCDIKMNSSNLSTGSLTNMVATNEDSSLVRTSGEKVRHPAIGVNLKKFQFSQEVGANTKFEEIFIHELLHFLGYTHLRGNKSTDHQALEIPYAVQYMCFHGPGSDAYNPDAYQAAIDIVSSPADGIFVNSKEMIVKTDLVLKALHLDPKVVYAEDEHQH